MDESGRNGYEPNRIDLISRLSNPPFIALIRYLNTYKMVFEQKKEQQQQQPVRLSVSQYKQNRTIRPFIYPTKPNPSPPTTTTIATSPFLLLVALFSASLSHTRLLPFCMDTHCIHVCLSCCWCFVFTSVPQ